MLAIPNKPKDRNFLISSSAGLYGVEQKSILRSFNGPTRLEVISPLEARISSVKYSFLRIEENNLTAGRIETEMVHR